MTKLRLHKILGRCLMAHAEIPAAIFAPNFPWPALLAIANQHLLTPSLYARLTEKGAIAAIPAEVRDYLATLHACNAERNRRLAAQAAEAVDALNRHGIEPLLLKGVVALLDDSPIYPARMITDLDIVVAPGEGTTAIVVLAELGYRQTVAPSPHTLGDFTRPRDVGAIDLHVALLAEPPLMPLADARTERCARGALRYRVLSPTDRVRHLILHDSIQDHGYFDGALNLRHLYELAQWMRTNAVAWDEIRAPLARRGLHSALDVSCAAAAALFGAPRIGGARSPLATLMVARAMLRMRYPTWVRGWEILGNVQRALAGYRLADRGRPLPRLRHAIAYVREHRARTAERLLHVLFHRRA